MQNEKQLTILNFDQIKTMGAVFAESGMFADAKAAAQAIVKIQAGQEIGVPPFAAMSGIHIIQGKPAIGAGLMASCVKSSGKYDYKVIEQTDKNCSIDFYQGSEKIGNSSFSATEAKAAGTKNMDKFPKNMLFARAMSNGVKWFTPDVFSGPVYTPEELGEVKTEDISHEVVKEEPKNVTKKNISAAGIAKAIPRLLAGEPGVYDNLVATFNLTPTQDAEVKQAEAFHKTKAPLYALLNTANFVDNEFNEAKAAVDACATETNYQELHKALTDKQSA